MHITIEKGGKSRQIVTIFQHLKTQISSINIYLDDEHLYIQAMPSSQIGLFELNLCKDWFQEYDVTQPVTLGVNCELLHKMIHCFEKEHTLSFHFEEDGDKMFVHLDSDKSGIISLHFGLPLLDLDLERLNVPDVEYVADIQINSSLLEKTIEQLQIFANALNVKCSEDVVALETTLESSIEHGQMKAEIHFEDMKEYLIEEDETINLNFNLQYLNWMVQFSRVAGDVNMHFSPDIPMKLKYNLDNVEEGVKDEITKVEVGEIEEVVIGEEDKEVQGDEEEGEEGEDGDVMQNYIQLFLAPQIENY